KFDKHIVIQNNDMELKNSFDNPNVIVPVKITDGTVENGEFKTHVKPLSWNVFVFTK
ncbi:MAG: alpha-N-arabinofuranosidase, partial [Lachnospiraceae bacterium]|nr:alpha-N-arabinofuranosidase [Lachnospiraceae bacterium]